MQQYREDKVAAEGYLVLVPDLWKYFNETRVRGIRIDRFRATKPSLKRGEVVVKVKLWFDKQQLKENIPVVEADVHNFGFLDPALEVLPDDVAAVSIETGPVTDSDE